MFNWSAFFPNKSNVYSLSVKKMAAPRGRPKKLQKVQKNTLLTYCLQSEPKLNVTKDIIEKILYDVVC